MFALTNAVNLEVQMWTRINFNGKKKFEFFDNLTILGR